MTETGIDRVSNGAPEGHVCACLLAVSHFPRHQTAKNLLSFEPSAGSPIPDWHFLLHEDNAFPSVSFKHVREVLRVEARPVCIRMASDLNPRSSSGKGTQFKRLVVEAEFDQSIERTAAVESLSRELRGRFGMTDKGSHVVQSVWETIAFQMDDGAGMRARYEVDISSTGSDAIVLQMLKANPLYSKKIETPSQTTVSLEPGQIPSSAPSSGTSLLSRIAPRVVPSKPTKPLTIILLPCTALAQMIRHSPSSSTIPLAAAKDIGQPHISPVSTAGGSGRERSQLDSGSLKPPSPSSSSIPQKLRGWGADLAPPLPRPTSMDPPATLETSSKRISRRPPVLRRTPLSKRRPAQRSDDRESSRSRGKESRSDYRLSDRRRSASPRPRSPSRYSNAYELDSRASRRRSSPRSYERDFEAIRGTPRGRAEYREHEARGLPLMTPPATVGHRLSAADSSSAQETSPLDRRRDAPAPSPATSIRAHDERRIDRELYNGENHGDISFTPNGAKAYHASASDRLMDVAEMKSPFSLGTRRTTIPASLRVNLVDLVTSLNRLDHFETSLDRSHMAQIIIDVLGLEGIHRPEQFQDDGIIFRKSGFFGKVTEWHQFIVSIDEEDYPVTAKKLSVGIPSFIEASCPPIDYWSPASGDSVEVVPHGVRPQMLEPELSDEKQPPRRSWWPKIGS